MQLFTEFIRICRQAAHNVGWEGGLRVERDTTQLGSGGNPANTEHTFMVWNRIGRDVHSGEYSAMVLTESNKDQGDAVSMYLKSEKRGAGPAWAGVFELRDKWNKPNAAVGIEVDMFTAGPATDHDGGDLSANGGRLRVGVDIVGGDESFKSDGVRTQAEGSIGLHIYATSTSPWYRWLNGAAIADYKVNGLVLKGKQGGDGPVPGRAIDIRGEHVVGIDFTRGTFQDVIRVRAGMAVAFDEYGDWLIKRDGDEMVFQQRARQPDGSWKHVTVMAVTRTGEVKAKKFTVLS